MSFSLPTRQLLRKSVSILESLSSRLSTGSNAVGQHSTSPVNSWNEWDPLEEVIIGIPDYAIVPHLNPEVKVCVGPSNWDFFEKNAGRYFADAIPRDHWQKLCEEVEEYVRVLTNEGIKVVRPEPVDHREEYKLLNIKSQGFYSAMPRDFLMVIGDELIEAPMTWRSRFFEYTAYRPLILDYWRRGAKWTVAPKAVNLDKLFGSNLDPTFNPTDFITESEPTFDAADFIRAGRDIFVQRSQVTNLSGIEWVRRHLAPRGINVHQLTFSDPRPMHIDATFLLVKPGLAIANPDRPCEQAEALKAAGWQVVLSPRPLISPDHTLWLGSIWLSMNVLMLGPDRMVIDADETELQEFYAKHGIKTIPIKYKHAYSIGGGFHCWSSDIRRQSKLQSYFDWSHGTPATFDYSQTK